MTVMTTAAAFASLAVLVHVAGFLILGYRLGASDRHRCRRVDELVTVVRTVRDIGPFEANTLGSTFDLNYPHLQILFCASHPGDPAVPLVLRLVEANPQLAARLLIGDDNVSTNAKLNNMVKGWREARASWVIFADSNLLLPPDYVQSILAAWEHDTGAVCAPPIGSQPQGLWAEVECAFLNGYQARWQYTAAAVGMGFAQGKTMLLHRDVIARGGDITALGAEPAEDAALTKLVRAQGLSVRLAEPRFTQPVGYRTLRQMLDRQTRWAQLRRATFASLYAAEMLGGMAVPLAVVMFAAHLVVWPPTVVGAAFVASWLFVEAVFTWAVGWHLSWRSPFAWLLRETLLPVVWIQGWLRQEYSWGGSTVVLGSRSVAGSETRATV